ncbi:MAG: YqaJ viral recombinase family protein [Pseudomonadota bacterium]
MNAPVKNLIARQVHNLVQGSDEWHRFRLVHDGASEAAAMLGISTKTTRTELLKMKATGLAKEFSDWVQKNILDYGHEVEAKARAILEGIIGQDLYPATYSFGLLSASCDGLTMDGEIAFEHKQISKELFDSVMSGVLPEEYQPQCQQIMHVTGAKKVIFTVSDGTEENCARMEVLPVPAWVQRIEAGWVQFRIDRENYKPAAVTIEAVGRAPEALPALDIRVMGMVQSSNLAEFKEQAIAVFKNISTDLNTDQEFADAAKTVTWCKGIEEKLDLAKENALGQTKTIDELFRAIDEIKEEARTKRLALDKLVTKRKDERRLEIVQGGKNAFDEHIAAINTRLGKIKLPDVIVDFGGAIKGLKLFSTMQDAVDTELARAKIEANTAAEKIEVNLGSLRTLAKDHAFLFADAQQLVMKENDYLVLLIKSRITAHETEQQRIRDEQTAKEEQARLDAVAEEARRATEEATPAPVAVQSEVQPESKAETVSAPAVATSAPTSAPRQQVASGAQVLAKMKLGEINARIAPLLITSDGLASIGFNPVEIDKSAKLYRATDFPLICLKLAEHLMLNVKQQVAA